MKDYRSSHLVEYEEPTRRGYLCLLVLPMLIGRPWDDVALAHVHSLRPSCIRVIVPHGCQKTDAVRWRVTVHLGDDGLIKNVEQEVEVGLPDGIPHGAGLQAALQFGSDSPQVAWHRIPGTVMYVFGKISKIDNDGVEHPYPRPEGA